MEKLYFRSFSLLFLAFYIFSGCESKSNSNHSTSNANQSTSNSNQPAISESFFRDSTTKVVEVKSLTGRIWMDRNLGASQVAESLEDKKASGDVYQWGRSADGHQVRPIYSQGFADENTTEIRSKTNLPKHGKFIVHNNKPPDDWLSPSNNNLWHGVNGVNCPCPIGFRLPTEKEWVDEVETWYSKSADGAFASPLKLPLVSGRIDIDGSPGNGGYWSSILKSAGNNEYFPYYLWFRRLDEVEGIRIEILNTGKMEGRAVRCIKD